MKLRKMLIEVFKLRAKRVCTILKYLLLLIVELYVVISILCFTYLTYEILLAYGDFSYMETDTVTKDLLVIYTYSTVNMMIIIIIYMLNKMYKKDQECLKYKAKYLRYEKRYTRLQTENEKLRKQLIESE